ncbi:MAG TPA: sugar transferase [Turneriella sp.]|nr:sugar transferase [Turneriella sp.]
MLKRSFDFLASLIGLILLCPLFVVIAIAVKISSAGPVFFRQLRVGFAGKLFQIHKFRTMRIDAEKKGKLTIGKDSRVTRVGYFLRKTKLDELPQLLNVLKGDMSLVGPRPEVPEFIEYYSPIAREKILSVRPGITDMASIEMVDENKILAEYENPHQAYIEKILPLKEKYYLYYVEKQSLWFDIYLIFKTFIKILTR